MKEYKDIKNSKELLKEQIFVIENIPTGVQPRAEVILVFLGEKPAAEMYLPNKDNADHVVDDLRRIGLYAEVIEGRVQGKHAHAVDIGVAKSQELLDELKQTKSNENHRRYGELMGYPSSAIDAFLGENEAEKLSSGEQTKMTEGLSDVLVHFRFSKQHAEEELAKLKKWFRIIAEHAPELFDELYKKEEADKFKQYALNSQ